MQSGTPRLGTFKESNASKDSTKEEPVNHSRHGQMASAPDIAQGLLNEIRKLQQVIQEKDRLIMDLEIHKADKEKDQEVTQKHLRQKARVEEKLKEDNWNLEVANQDLQANLLELNQTLAKLNSDHKKTLQQLQSSLGQAELVKSQQEAMAVTMGMMKTKHDQEQQILRRNNGILQRDIGQLKKRLDDTIIDLKISRAKLAIKSTISNDTKGGSTVIDSQHHGNDYDHNNPAGVLDKSDTKSTHLKPSSSDTSIPSTTLQHSLGMDTLKQSLGHAHRMNSHLRSILQKEKVEKIELRRLLLDAQEAMEQMQQTPINDKPNSSNSKGGRTSRVNKGQTRFKVARKQDRPSKKDIEMGDDRLQLLAPNTTSSASKLGGGTETALISMDNNNDLLSGDDHTDDASSLNSEDDSGSDDQQFEISPMTKSLDMELGALGRPFKSLSSELEESFTERQYFDKGVNTHDDSFSAQRQSVDIDSGIVTFDQTILITNNDISQCTKRSPTISPVLAVHHNPVYRQPPTSTATLQHVPVSLQHVSVGLKPPFTTDAPEGLEPALPLPMPIDFDTSQPISSALETGPIFDPQPFTSSATTIADLNETAIPSTFDHIKSDMNSATPYTSKKTACNDTPSPINSISAPALISTIPPTDCTTDDQPLSSLPANPSSTSLSPSVLSLTLEHYQTDLDSGNAGVPEVDGLPLSGLETQCNSDESPILDPATSVVGDRRPLVSDGARREEFQSSINSALEHQTPLDSGNVGVPEINGLPLSGVETQCNIEQSLILDPATSVVGDRRPLVSDGASRDEFQSSINSAPEHQTPLDLDHDSPKQPIVTHSLQGTLDKEDSITCREQVTNSANIDTTIDTDECALEHATYKCNNLSNPTYDAMSMKEIAALDTDDATTNDHTEDTQPKVYNKQQQSVDDVKATTTTRSVFLSKAAASRQSAISIPCAAPKQELSASPIPSPMPSTSTLSTATSCSSSRFGILSGLMNLQPSQSSPIKPVRPRPSPSTSSLRKLVASTSTTVANPRQAFSLRPHKRNSHQNQQNHPRDSLDRHSKLSSPSSYGTVRITENTTYSRAARSSLRPHQQPLTKRSMQSSRHMEQQCDTSFKYSLPSSNSDLVLAITQTMIGEWMWKNTRRHVGSGISENKHKRFFWVHPYTRTLYWGTSEPGIDADEAKAKSAFIEGVSSIPSHDTTGASPLSLLIKTGKRDLKLTAPTLERHELWRLSLSYILVPQDIDEEDVCRTDAVTLPIATANDTTQEDRQEECIPAPIQNTRSLHANGDVLAASIIATISTE